MAYSFYLDGTELPVVPGSLKLKIKNANQTLTLINGGEINLLKTPGLTEIEFTALLPEREYPFTRSFQPPEIYLNKLEKLKTGKKPFQFVVSRESPNGGVLFDTNLSVSLEEYQIREDAKALGFDTEVSITLKQYRPFGTKTVSEEGGIPEETRADGEGRPESGGSYTVVRGDCLWNIAKARLGDGSRWKEIYQLNQDKIENPNRIYPGQELQMPSE